MPGDDDPGGAFNFFFFLSLSINVSSKTPIVLFILPCLSFTMPRALMARVLMPLLQA